ncbi:sushi, von Willebrand factor type A, EGF and pentraxin domain-containing protein 1-like [Branchiostoma floridae x Branchiostoma belcheri]
MESGAIPDDSITASESGHSAQQAFFGRLNGTAGWGGWGPENNNIGQWLQVDLGVIKRVTGTITQGVLGTSSWVTTYKLEYSGDGCFWTTYASSNGSDKVFTGNTNTTTPVTNLLDNPVDARYVRFYPQSWHQRIAMRVEILGCETELLWGLALSDAGVGHLNVSWTVVGNLPISRYSLRYQPADGSGSYQDLSPAPGAGATSATVQGLRAHTEYTLTLTSFDEEDQPNGVINGTFTTVCQYPLGMESGAIPDDSITASETGHSGQQSFYGRLKGTAGWGGWGPENNNIGQWLQVDLGDLKRVTGTVTQGGRLAIRDNWVTSYKLSYSIYGTFWTTYASNGSDKVFTANTDKKTPVTNLLDSSINARYVRFYPETWHQRIAMRVEILGCSTYNGQCTELTTPANSALKTTSSQNQTLVRFTCNTGYVLNGVANTTCQADGTWSNPVPTCTPVQCLARTTPTNGAVTPTGAVSYPNGVTFTCNSGYHFIGEATYTATCQADGTRSNPVPTCMGIPCQQLTAPSNGALSPLAPHVYPDGVTFTCNPGYVLNGAAAAACQTDGTWSNTVPTCTPVLCPARTAPTNGAVTPTGAVSYPNRVTFTCNTGYQLIGDTAATCQADGTWSNSVPTCTLRPCPSLSTPQNGALSPLGPYIYPNGVTFTCDTGYMLNGASAIVCQADGTWTVQCPARTAPTNGVVTPTGSVFYPNGVTFTCNTGYQLIGDAAATCQADRTWSNPVPTCTLRPCPSLSTPQNGALSPLGPYIYPNGVTFTCDTGYILNGASAIVCQADGTWSNSVPTCVESISLLRLLTLTAAMPKTRRRSSRASATQTPPVDDTPPAPRPSPSTLSTGVGTDPDALALIPPAPPTSTNLDDRFFRTPLTQPAQAGPSRLSTPPENTDSIIAVLSRMEQKQTAVDQRLEALQSEVWACRQTPSTKERTWAREGNKKNYTFNIGLRDQLTTATVLTSPEDKDAIINKAKGSLLWDTHRTILAFGCLVAAPVPRRTPSIRHLCELAWNQPDTAYTASLQPWASQTVSSRTTVVGAAPKHEKATSSKPTVQCPARTAPTNGVVTPTGSVFYPNGVTFTCNTGYQLIGDAAATCQADRTWSNPVPTCTTRPCPSLSVPQNGALSPLGPYVFPNGVTFTCDTGYMLNGASAIVCQADGTWSNSVPTCAPVQCPARTAPTNGVVTPTGSVFYPNGVTFTCNTGYQLIGDAAATCQADGTWSDPVPTCTPVQCPARTAPTNGAVTPEGAVSYPNRATFTCNTGYQLIGSAVATCQADGTVQCPARTAPTNGVVTPTGSVFYPNGVTFTCNTGYQLIGDAAATCQADGTWSDPVPTCTSRPCPSLSVPQNGALSPLGPYVFPNGVTFTCDTGYMLNGASAIVCQADGTWSNYVPTCAPVQCPARTAPSNGLATPTGSVFYPNGVTFTCNTGYQLIGDAAATCQADGTWSDPVPTCTPVQCPARTAPTNGAVTPEGAVSYPNRVTFTCNTGYHLIGSAVATCQSDGTWSNSVPICTAVQCPAQSAPTNGVVTPTASVFYPNGVTFTCNTGYQLIGDAALIDHFSKTVSIVVNPKNGALSPLGPYVFPNGVTFTCDTGYMLNGASAIVCQADGTWSNSVPTCAPVQCPARSAPTNGVVTPTGSVFYPNGVAFTCNTGYQLIGDAAATKTVSIVVNPQNGALSPLGPYVFPNGVTFTCDTGYMLNGASAIVCQADGTWSNSVPTCALRPCPSLSAPQNGALSPLGPYVFPNGVTFTCDTGYMLNGASAIVCQADGTWSNSVPTCAPVQCPARTASTNGVVTPTGSVFYPNGVTFTCNTGYQLIGDAAATCQADGTWSNSVPTCTPVQCPARTAPTNGAVTPEGAVSYPNRATFTCNTGYQLIGAAAATCQADGTWSNPVSTCTPIQCQALTAPTNGAITPTGAVSYPNSVTFTCTSGHLLNGATAAACQADGTWSNPVPTCSSAQCQALTAPTNGAVTPTGAVSYPNSVTFTCNPGYVLNGAAAATCQADGTWSNPVPTCSSGRCPTLTTAANGALSTTATSYHTVVTFTCNMGYVLNGFSTATCQTDGTWNNHVPTCTRERLAR